MMLSVTELQVVDFGQYDLKRNNMLCAELPPRIYESLKTLCCLAAAMRPLQANEIAQAASLPPAQTANILQLLFAFPPT